MITTFTNEQILKKAIMIAKKKGYRFLNVIYDGKDTLDTAGQNPEYYYHLIFSHDFAQACWGEEESMIEGHCEGIIKEGWQYHLQQMVISEEPLKYLERFL